MKKACVIIPARYASSRFPGKPLYPLLGKPMILWVAEICEKAIGKANVFIATDDVRIKKVVQENGFQVVMTSSDALTGTDRIAEASLTLDYEIFINVQGDEPLINPKDILKCIEVKNQFPSYIINSYTKLIDIENPESKNIPKVLINENNDLVYMSRSPLPSYKDEKLRPSIYFKQVCIYGFSKEDLLSFRNYKKKSKIESFEDIEILRFFDLNKKIKMFEVDPGSLAVDALEDVINVEEALKNRV